MKNLKSLKKQLEVTGGNIVALLERMIFKKISIFNKVFSNLANNMQKGLAVEAQENLSEAEQLFQAMNTYAFDCSLEVFAFIGKGYVANPEFKKNIDQFGVGTAQYAADVIQAYVHK